LNHAKKAANAIIATTSAAIRVSGTVTPRISAVFEPHGEDVDAEPAGDLGLHDDVDADRHDRRGHDRRTGGGPDQEALDGQGDRHCRERANEQRDRERHAAVSSPGGHVDPDHDQAGVCEVHDLGGLEHHDEAERKERVHRAEREPADEQLEERVHGRIPSDWSAAWPR
jgi:hypothetical protein